MRKLKAFVGNLDGRHRILMATTSLTAFYKITGITRDFASETSNAADVTLAMSEPGVIYAQLYETYSNQWTRLGHRESMKSIFGACRELVPKSRIPKL